MWPVGSGSRRFRREKASAITSECFDRGLLIGPCGTGGRVLKHLINTTVDNSVNPF